MHQIAFGGRVLPVPAGVAHRQHPLAVLGGREGKRREVRTREGEQERGSKRMGGKRREKGRTASPSQKILHQPLVILTLSIMLNGQMASTNTALKPGCSVFQLFKPQLAIARLRLHESELSICLSVC